MKIYLASDHAGFALKELVKVTLQTDGYQAVDMGAYILEKLDDYPDFIGKAAIAVSQDVNSKGIIFGGSGQGEAIVANKFSDVRAVVFYGPVKPISSIDISNKESLNPFSIIQLARIHNNANILSLGARFLTNDDALHAVSLFLKTPFSENSRHQRRIGKIKIIEESIRRRE